jgi:hypothetical protein
LPDGKQSWAELRDKYAKGDDKISKRLGRYSSAESALDALIAAQNKIASGGLKSAKPENATPEQLAEWRAEHGIPDTPEGYEISIDESLEISPETEAVLEGFIEAAHNADMLPGQVQAAMEYLLSSQEDAKAKLAERDMQARVDAEEALRSQWGPEFRLNINAIDHMFAQAPDGVKDLFLGARGPDGSVLANNPLMLRWLADLSREINPMATVVPSGSNMASLEAEISTLNELMADRESKYWVGPESRKLQQRYEQLIDAQLRSKAH